MLITKTPFRMSFFGGGTDLPAFFNEYGGAVISTTFNKYCYVNVRHLPPFMPYISELVYSKFERVNSIDDIASTIGIGSLEMAIALSTANPFLLIGGVLSLTSGLKGLINTGSVVYFKNVNMHLSLEFSTNTLNIKNYVDMYKIENNTDYSIDGQISKYSF